MKINRIKMGSSNSVKLPRVTLSGFKLGTVKKSRKSIETLNLYYVPGKYWFTIPSNYEFKESKDDTVEVSYTDLYHHSHFMAVSKNVKGGDPNQLDFKYYNKKIETKSFYFINAEEYSKAYELMDNLNTKQRDGKNRYLAVIANPMSGKKMSISYYQNILKPLLDSEGIQSELFVFEQKQGLLDWIQNLNPDTIKFNEVILISGDGSFHQVYNSFANHKLKEKLLSLPIGLVPGGSGNATAWAVGGIDPYIAIGNILKGRTIKADMLEVTLDSQKKVYGGIFTYGISVDIMNNNDKRKLFGTFRYLTSTFYRLYLSRRLPSYPIELYYKLSKEKGGNDEWKRYEKTSLYSYITLTHELRTTLLKKPLIPVTRFNDNKMIVHLMDNWTKVEGNLYFFKLFTQKNLYMKWSKTFEADEIKLKFPKEKSLITVDGELSKVEEANIKLLPSHVTFVGSVIDFSENEMKIKQDLKII